MQFRPVTDMYRILETYLPEVMEKKKWMLKVFLRKIGNNSFTLLRPSEMNYKVNKLNSRRV